jgi:hypothetical protein
MNEQQRLKKVISEQLLGFKPGPRHPCEVTADRLADHLDKYPDDFDGASRDDIGHLRYILQSIADRERKGGVR